MTRLLFIVNHPRWFVTHRLPVARGAAAAGYEVHVATPAGEGVETIRELFPWHELRLRRGGTAPHTELRAIGDIVRVMKRVRPEIVHNVTLKPVLYGTIAARIAKVPAVVNAVAGLGRVFTGKPTMLTRVGSLALRIGLKHKKMRVIFQNPDDREVFLRRGWIAPSQAVLIRGAGVDLERFQPSRWRAAALSGPPEAHHEGPLRAAALHSPLILFASRLLYSKGLADFVEAARLVHRTRPAARFAIAGEPDPENPAAVEPSVIEAWVAEGAIENLGHVENMNELLAETTLFCLPSAYGEGVPKVLLEAAASGLPIVTTDISGCREAVRDGDNGFLVPTHDPQALANAILRILGDEELARRMGRRSRERAESEFGVAEVVQKTLAVYEALL